MRGELRCSPRKDSTSPSSPGFFSWLSPAIAPPCGGQLKDESGSFQLLQPSDFLLSAKKAPFSSQDDVGKAFSAQFPGMADGNIPRKAPPGRNVTFPPMALFAEKRLYGPFLACPLPPSPASP